MLPDVRQIKGQARENVLNTFAKVRAGGIMIAAPGRDGVASPLRRELDTVLLVALGLTAGQAAALLERLYAGYGRWRANIEDVESQMRAHRRQMHATGQSRDQRPVEAAGRRVWEEIEHLMPLYPKAFLPTDEIVEILNVPTGVAIPESEPLFDAGILRTKTKTIDLGSYSRVRYAAMLRTLGLMGNVELPVSIAKAGAIADLFEKDQARFHELALESSAKYVSGADTIRESAEIARKHWYATCRKNALLKAVTPPKDGKLN